MKFVFGERLCLPSAERDTPSEPVDGACSVFRLIEIDLVVTGKDMKRTLRENPRKAERKSTKFWRSSV